MKQETAERFLELLREQINTETGEVIVLKMVGMMNDRDAETLANDMEDMVDFPDYLTESEAKEVVSKFTNFDGSKGPHWRDPQAMFDAVNALGMYYELKDRYNRWAWYATMNMVWSDDWGVLRNYISNQDEVKVIAELTTAKLMDRDRGYCVRHYFDLD